MRRKIVVMLLALTVIMNGCSEVQSNVAEYREISASTEEIAVKETVTLTGVNIRDEEIETESKETTEVADTIEMIEETTEFESEFTITVMSAIKYAKRAVNVRKGPSAEYEKVGLLSANQQVTVTGQAETGWYQIILDGETAYVSNLYLADEKVAAHITPSIGNESNNESTTVSEYAASSGGDSSVPEETEWIDDWGEPDFVGGGIGTGKPVTDGYGPGVEIEIRPLP